jgi:hypothetical protein
MDVQQFLLQTSLNENLHRVAVELNPIYKNQFSIALLNRLILFMIAKKGISDHQVY